MAFPKFPKVVNCPPEWVAGLGRNLQLLIAYHYKSSIPVSEKTKILYGKF